MSIRYSYMRNEDGTANITVIGEFTRSVASNHPNFIALRDYLQAHETDADADEVLRLVDSGKEAKATLKRLTERIVVEDDELFFDGDKIDNLLSKQIVRLTNDGDDFNVASLALFMEKLATNPNKKSRRSLYAYLDRHGFSITPEGDFLAYKGVQRLEGDAEGTYRSIMSGTARVNDVEQTGAIPQEVGDVVTMPRLDVDDDRDVACSEGLHAGTYSYASGFGRGHTLNVIINPRDVVSVPKDSGEQKLRVCRYVIAEVNSKGYHDKATYSSPVAPIVDYSDEEDDYAEECYYCGEEGHSEDDCDTAYEDQLEEEREAREYAEQLAREAAEDEEENQGCYCGDPDCPGVE